MRNPTPLSDLSDTELQARIERFTKQMIAADERFQRTGAIADRVSRDQAWIAENELLNELARRQDNTTGLQQLRRAHG